jgi:hypothetical protein
LTEWYAEDEEKVLGDIRDRNILDFINGVLLLRCINVNSEILIHVVPVHIDQRDGELLGVGAVFHCTVSCVWSSHMLMDRNLRNRSPADCERLAEVDFLVS